MTKKLLGEGATGKVVAGTWKKKSCEVPVAIKTLELHVLDQKLHLREISMLLKSGPCPNIVHFHGVLEDGDGRFHLVMEQYGVDLQGYFQQKSPSLSVCLRVLGDVASALCFLHNSCFIHRDVKPKNILLTKCFPVSGVLGDFGCARVVAPSQMSIGVGTSSYRDPAIRGGDCYGTEVDIWSFGKVVQELNRVIPFIL